MNDHCWWKKFHLQLFVFFIFCLDSFSFFFVLVVVLVLVSFRFSYFVNLFHCFVWVSPLGRENENECRTSFSNFPSLTLSFAHPLILFFKRKKRSGTIALLLQTAILSSELNAKNRKLWRKNQNVFLHFLLFSLLTHFGGLFHQIFPGLDFSYWPWESFAVYNAFLSYAVISTGQVPNITWGRANHYT